MPRKKSVPQLVHHKPSGQGRLRLNGKDIYLGKYGTDECDAAYEGAIAEYLAEGRKPTGKNINNLLVLVEWFHQFVVGGASVRS